jgi:hypothetical protein
MTRSDIEARGVGRLAWQLAKRKADELEDTGNTVANKHSRDDVEVRTSRSWGRMHAACEHSRGVCVQAGDRALASFLTGVRDLPLASLSETDALAALASLRARLDADGNDYTRAILAEL